MRVPASWLEENLSSVLSAPWMVGAIDGAPRGDCVRGGVSKGAGCGPMTGALSPECIPPKSISCLVWHGLACARAPWACLMQASTVSSAI